MADEFVRDLKMELELEAEGAGLKELMKMNRKMNQITRATRLFDYQFTKAMKTMPEHLKPLAVGIRKTEMDFREMRRNAVYSLEDMQDSVIKTRVGFDKLTSVSKTGKEATQTLMDFGKQAKVAQLAVLGLSEDGMQL